MQLKLVEALKAPLLECIAMYFPLRSFFVYVYMAKLLNLWRAVLSALLTY